MYDEACIDEMVSSCVIEERKKVNTGWTEEVLSSTRLWAWNDCDTVECL